MDNLHSASKRGDLEAVKHHLAQKGVNINLRDYRSGQTALHATAAKGHLEIVKFLVQSRADINSSNRFSETPLHAAAEKGHLEIVKFLVQSGAEKDTKDNQNQTPLNFAAFYGHLEIVKFLVESGADKEAKNKEGQTAFHFAQMNGRTTIVDYLNNAKSSNKTGVYKLFKFYFLIFFANFGML
jgi:ankyrin repeat protein